MTVGDLLKHYALPLMDLDVVGGINFQLKREDLGRPIKMSDLPNEVFNSEVQEFIMLSSRHFQIVTKRKDSDVFEGQIKIGDYE